MKKETAIYCLGLMVISMGALAQTPASYLFSSEIKKKADAESNVWNLQNYAVQYSKVGNYKASVAIHREFIDKAKALRNAPKEPMPDSAYFASFKPMNAVEAIVQEAKKYKVVITNEAHYQPENRVFTRLLLERLYREGFRYLGLEGLAISDKITKAKGDSLLGQRKYPLRSSGFYIDEPQYGNLVRAALSIGFTLVAYEYSVSDKKDPMERLKGREIGQAANIAKILEKDPNAKILVHCGYGHLNEDVKPGSDFGLMGAMLKINHNIDPLTVDQEYMLDVNDRSYTKWAKVDEPSVFVSGNEYFGDRTENHKVDMVVFFPKTAYVNDRPNWLMYDKEMRYYFPEKLSEKYVYPLMLLAYKKGEDINTAVPVDIVEIESPKDKTALVLGKGNYVLQVKEASGVLHQQSIKVK